MISDPKLGSDQGMLPNLADAIARLATGRLGQLQPIVCHPEQMRFYRQGTQRDEQVPQTGWRSVDIRILS
jgi:hypothetical protein